MATSSAEAPCPVCQVLLADLLAHRHDDALPAHHRTQAQRSRYTATFTHVGMNLVAWSSCCL